jgi:hypothetical protein
MAYSSACICMLYGHVALSGTIWHGMGVRQQPALRGTLPTVAAASAPRSWWDWLYRHAMGLKGNRMHCIQMCQKQAVVGSRLVLDHCLQLSSHALVLHGLACIHR